MKPQSGKEVSQAEGNREVYKQLYGHQRQGEKTDHLEKNHRSGDIIWEGKSKTKTFNWNCILNIPKVKEPKSKKSQSKTITTKLKLRKNISRKFKKLNQKENNSRKPTQNVREHGEQT